MGLGWDVMQSRQREKLLEQFSGVKGKVKAELKELGALGEQPVHPRVMASFSRSYSIP